MNAALTTTTVPPTDAEIEDLSLVDADKLVLLAFSNLQTAARIYKKEGLTQSAMVERLTALGIKCSERTIQRVFSDLRKQNSEGFNPVGSSTNSEAVRQRKHRASVTTRQIGGMSQTNVEKSTQQTPINSQSTDDQRIYTEPSICSPVQVVQPIVDTYTDGPEARVISMGTAAQRDWQQAVEHLKALRQFTHDYFDPAGPITERQWEEFHAECHDLAYFASSRFQNLRKENERTARSIIGACFTGGDSAIQEA